MIKHYLKASFASLWKRKWFSLLTLFSIAIAMVVVTCGATIWNMYSAPIAPEVNKDRTFYLDTNLGNINLVNSETRDRYSKMLANFLKQEQHQLKTPETITAYKKLGSSEKIRNNKVREFETMWTDDRFFQVFEFDFVAGKPYGPENAKDGQIESCVLSDEYARWYFGDTDCVGKFVERGSRKLKVCGVVRNPVTLSELKSDIYYLETITLYLVEPTVVFLCSSSGDRAALDVELSKLKDESEGLPPISFKTTTSISRTLSSTVGFSRDMIPLYLGLIFIALIIPALCLIDILKSNQSNRSEELAVRRSFGAPAISIARLLLADNLLITTLGSLLGLGFSFLFFGLLSDFSWSALFWVFFDWRAFLYYIAVFLIIGGIAGVFPAYRLAKQPIVNALNARDFEKSQLGQIIKKRRRYYLPFAVLFLSFFALVIMLGMYLPIVVRSLSLKLPVPKENRLECTWEWKTMDLKNNDLDQQIKQGVLKLPGVLAADFVVNNLGDNMTLTILDNARDHICIVHCGEDFDKVFDIKLEEGRWFGDDPDEGSMVVITRQHADFLGIKHLSNDQFFTCTLFGNTLTTKNCRIVGITGNVENMRNPYDMTDLNRNIFPVFFRSNEKVLDSPATRLLIKMADGYDFKQLNEGILVLQQKLGHEASISQKRLSTLDEIIWMQLADVWKQLKVIFGILFMLITYIFVALFGNFWKMTQRRTVEIGIRRAVGHTRARVVWYLLSESLLFLVVVLVPATIIFLNIYPLAKVKAPVSAYLISVGILLIIVVLATLIPAVYAGRIHPVEALAEE